VKRVGSKEKNNTVNYCSSIASERTQVTSVTDVPLFVVHKGTTSRSLSRRIRRKLKLTQAQLASSFGVGKVVFSRYERGETRPTTPLLKLLKLIDRHPDLLEEIEKM
jgi:putative zinc finger/helix-turn-helix YgiT family protein